MTEISITTKHKTLHRGLDVFDSGCIFYSTAAAFLIEEPFSRAPNQYSQRRWCPTPGNT